MPRKVKVKTGFIDDRQAARSPQGRKEIEVQVDAQSVRQLLVQQHQVVVLLRQPAQGVGAVVHADHFEVLVLEVQAEHLVEA